MGTNSSTPFNADLSMYRVSQKVPENNITYLTHIETEKEYMLRELTYNDENLYKKCLEDLERRKLIVSEHLTHLGRVEGKTIDHLCSNVYKIYAMWEYPQRYLSAEINQRALQRRKFEEKQIWSILASAILGLSTLQKQKIRHEAVNSKNILLDNDGLVKIVDPMATQARNNFDTVYSNRHAKSIYLSPEQCQTLEAQTTYSNPYKNDVWSMGMILLECGLLERQDHCYKDEYERIDWNNLRKSLSRFAQQYSQELKLITELMLKADYKDRPDWIDLEQYARKSTEKSELTSGRKDSERNESFYTPIYKYDSHVKPTNMVTSYQVTEEVGMGNQNKKVSPGRKESGYGQFVGQGGYQEPGKSSYQQAVQYSSVPYQPIQFHHPPIDPTFQPAQTKTYFSPYPLPPNLPPMVSQIPQPIQTFKPAELPPPKPIEPMNKPFAQTITTNYLPMPTFMENRTIPSYSQEPSTYKTDSFLLKPETSLQNEQIKTNIDILRKNTDSISEKNIEKLSNHELFVEKKQNLSKQEYLFTEKPEQEKNMISSIPLTKNAEFRSGQEFKTFGKREMQEKNSTQIEITKRKQNISESVYKKQESSKGELEESGQEVLGGTLEYVVETFKQGSRYEGYKLGDFRHGQGKFYYQDGGMYDGQWKHNKMDGYGSLYYQSGKIAYEGMWRSDLFQGKGKLYNESPEILEGEFDWQNFDEIDEYWEFYEGDFVEDLKTGKGKLMLSNGQYFQGTFENDMVEGPGTFHRKDQKIIKGVWHSNQYSS